MKIEAVASGLDVCEQGGEVGFALCQSFNVGDGRLVFASYLVERNLGLVQLLRDAVAIGRSLRQLSIEMCLARSELVGRRDQRRIVSLLRVAESFLGIVDRLFERGTRHAFLFDLRVEFSLALRGLPDRARCVGQLKLETVASGLDVGDLGGEVCFALRQAFNVGRGRQVVAPHLVERDLGLVQLPGDAVAIGGSLRQFSIEMRLALGELVGRRGQGRVVL